MQFMIHVTGAASIKARVPAVPAMLAGVWNEPERELLRPCPEAIRKALPARLLRLWDRNGAPLLWFGDNARFDGEGFSGESPYATITNAKGGYVATLYAIACKDA